LRVKLIEAGGAPKNRFVGIPTGFSKLFKSEVDWASKPVAKPTLHSPQRLSSRFLFELKARAIYFLKIRDALLIVGYSPDHLGVSNSR
jgi:hypothetical protein